MAPEGDGNLHSCTTVCQTPCKADACFSSPPYRHTWQQPSPNGNHVRSRLSSNDGCYFRRLPTGLPVPPLIMAKVHKSPEIRCIAASHGLQQSNVTEQEQRYRDFPSILIPMIRSSKFAMKLHVTHPHSQMRQRPPARQLMTGYSLIRGPQAQHLKGAGPWNRGFLC